MTDKMERLVNKINRARIKYVTLINPDKPDMVKILNERTLVPVAELNVDTGELVMLEHHYMMADLHDLEKLVQIIGEGL